MTDARGNARRARVSGGGNGVRFVEIEGDYAVVRLAPAAEVPRGVWDGRFCSVSKTCDELSVVCESDLIVDCSLQKEDGWRCLKVVGPLDFALTGILAAIAAPLAAAKISIFAVSTFDTDYVMVKRECLGRAKTVLTDAGFAIADA